LRPRLAIVELTPEQQAQKHEIRTVLERTGGNRTRAAELLGWSRVTLWKKMRRLGIDA
jgi:transcriptional regulator of acetoin/glycerol metabolism